MKTIVKISDTKSGESYWVSNADDCKDKTDKSGYQEAVRAQDVIQMGQFCYEPF